MRCVAIALVCLLTASGIAGCATEPLDAAPPSGVNLSGEWKFDPNLSDDPNRLSDPDETPQHAPGGHRGHGGGRGGGGMPPMGSPDGGGSNFGPAASLGGPGPAASGSGAGASGSSAGASGFLPVALTAPGLEQATTLPPAGSTSNSTNTTTRAANRGASINRLLKAPARMVIVQSGGTLLIKASMPDGSESTDEYRAGTHTTIPYGHDATAARSAGWRGPVFVVTTDAKKAGWREDDFALDEDGRLIMTTQTRGGRLGKVEIKRVYDRVRGAGSN